MLPLSPPQPKPARPRPRGRKPGAFLRGLGATLGLTVATALVGTVLLVLVELHASARDNRRMWLWPILLPRKLSARQSATLRARPVDRATTLVTGFFELPNGGSLRVRPGGAPYVLTSDRYWQWALRVLSFRAPMVVFTTRALGARVMSFRGELGLGHVTRVVAIHTRAWLCRPEFAMMRELLVERGADRTSHATCVALRLQAALRAARVPPWLLRAAGLRWSLDMRNPEATDLALPRARVARAAVRASRRAGSEPQPADAALAAHWSKVFWTREAVRRDHFGSDNFMWVDWGLLRGDHRDDVFMHRAWPGPRTVASFASAPRVHYVQYSKLFNTLMRPPRGSGRAAPSFGVCAAAFGGGKAALSRALDLFVGELWAELDRGALVEEETAMSRVVHRNPELFRCANPVFPISVPRTHYSSVTSFMA